MNKFNPFYLWSLYDPIDFSVVNGLPSSQLHKIVTFSTLSIYTHKQTGLDFGCSKGM